MVFDVGVFGVCLHAVCFGHHYFAVVIQFWNIKCWFGFGVGIGWNFCHVATLCSFDPRTICEVL